MSSHRSVEIQCPACGAAGEYLLWESVNRDLDPRAAASLGRGELLLHACPACGVKSEVVHPVLLHAMAQKEMVQFRAGDDLGDGLSPALTMMKALGPFVLWTVSSVADLREAARVYDAGLEMFAMMMFRFRLRAELVRSGKPEVASVHFDHLVEGDESAGAMFAVLVEGRMEVGYVKVPRAHIEENEAFLKEFRGHAVTPWVWTAWDDGTAAAVYQRLAGPG